MKIKVGERKFHISQDGSFTYVVIDIDYNEVGYVYPDGSLHYILSIGKNGGYYNTDGEALAAIGRYIDIEDRKPQMVTLPPVSNYELSVIIEGLKKYDVPTACDLIEKLQGVGNESDKV